LSVPNVGVKLYLLYEGRNLCVFDSRGFEEDGDRPNSG